VTSILIAGGAQVTLLLTSDDKKVITFIAPAIQTEHNSSIDISLTKMMASNPIGTI